MLLSLDNSMKSMQISGYGGNEVIKINNNQALPEEIYVKVNSETYKKSLRY